MKSVMDVKRELLGELHEICKMNHIKYVLGYKETLSYYKKGKIEDCIGNITVLMTIEEFKKFKNIVEENYPNRYIEYLLNNTESTNFKHRFGNKNTTLIDLRHLRRHNKNGIYISIKIISRPFSSKIKRKILDFHKSILIAKSRSLNNGRIGIKYFFGKIAILMTSVIGASNLVNYLYKYRCKNCWITSWDDCYELDNVLVDGIAVEPEIFRNILEIEVGNIKVFVPKNLNGYLSTFYGEEFSERDIPYIKKSEWMIEDTVVPYEETINLLKSVGTLDVYNENLDKQKKLISESKKYRKNINHAWKVYFMVRRWFDLETYFNENKDKFEKLYQRNDYEKLEELLEPFISTERKWKNRKIPYYSIREIEGLEKYLDAASSN